jgi:hypothetical protein
MLIAAVGDGLARIIVNRPFSLVAQQYDLFGIEVLPMLTLDNIAVMSRTALFERCISAPPVPRFHVIG